MSAVTGDAGRAPICSIHARTPWPMPPTTRPGREASQRRQLHRRRRGVARGCRQDADADGQALGVGEGGRRQRDAGGVEAVLDDPQLVGAAGLEAFGELDDNRRFELTRKADAEAR